MSEKIATAAQPEMETESSAEHCLRFFRDTRSRTESLCAPLQTEDYIPQPVDFISPPKWHLAHTTWFFEEFILAKYDENYRRYHPDFSYLFNSYYNGIGERILRTDRGTITRPGVEEVYKFRAHVNEAIEKLLQNRSEQELLDTLVLGLNHEQQHQELMITDLKYVLAQNPTWPVYKDGFSLVNQFDEQEAGIVKIEEGVYEIGFEGEGFHWDNERNRHKVYLQSAELNKRLVTNGEYLEFMEAGGYDRHEIWLDEGWSWVNGGDHYNPIKKQAPLYWHKIDGQWQHYTLEGLKPVDPQAILCHVNLFEAAAFAEWSGMRLPTEQEWEVAAANFATKAFTSGNRWEWTNSAYLPYPGFATAEGAIGEYNGKFMVNQMVLRGGSTATAPGHTRLTYRNFFHPHLQWQCTGIRLAKK